MVAEYMPGIVTGVCVGFDVGMGVYAVGTHILGMWLGSIC